MKFFSGIREYFHSLIKTDRIVAKTFIETFWVMLATECVNVLSKLIDGLMVGSMLGADAIAAHSMTSPFFGIVGVLSGVIAVGTQAQISQNIGKGELKGIEKFLSTALLFSLLACGVLLPWGYIFKGGITRLFGASGEAAYLAPLVEEYLLGLLPSMLPLIWNAILIPVLQINGDKKRVMTAVTVSVAVNFAGNLLSIGVFDMGMLGLSISTSLSQYAMTVIILLHFRKKDCVCGFSLRHFKPKALGESLRIGMPKAIRRLCNTLRPLFLNRWIILIGTGTAMSAFAVQNSLRAFLLLLAMTAASTARMIAGIYYGEEDKTAIKTLFRTSFLINLVLTLIIGAGLFIFAPVVAGLYIPNDPEIRELTVVCLRWFSLSLPFSAFNELYLSFLQGISQIKAVHVFTVFDKLLYVGVSALVLGSLFGIVGVFASFPLADMLLTLTFVLWAWVKNGKRPKKVTDLVVLPRNFGYDPPKSVEYTVLTRNDASGLPLKVEEFCRKQGIDPRRTFFASLCTEEMVINTVNHGFADGKPHSLYLRLIKKDEDLILRIKDDCALFNIVNECGGETEKDEFSNVGVKLVMSISKDVLYTNSLNTNSVIIRI